MTAFGSGVSEVFISVAVLIVIKATVVLLLAFVGLRLTRRRSASVRHLVLATAFGVLFALPWATLLVPTVHVDLATPIFDEYVSLPLQGVAIEPLTPPESVMPRSSQQPTLPRNQLLAAVWVIGVVVCAVPLLVGAAQVRRLRHTALPWIAGQAMIDELGDQGGLRKAITVVRHEALAAPATSGLQRHTILFPIEAVTWASEDLRRAAIHEIEHVCRRDCFVNALARTVCAMYWFHPLIWVAWQRLGLEAERACDDAVLRRAEPTVYADQLVTLASRQLRRTRHPLLAMANRRDLTCRVAAILDQRQHRGYVGRAATTAICAGACVLAVIISPLRAVDRSSGIVEERFERVGLFAPGDSAQRSSRPRFAVASIKSAKGDGPLNFGIQGGRFIATNVPVKLLIQRAYSAPNKGLLPGQIIGGASWIDSSRFDIEATPEVDVRAMTPDQLMGMIQSLLEERFQLRTHRESREMPVFYLVVADRGPKMKLSADQTPPTRQVTPPPADATPGVPPRGSARVIPSASGATSILTLVGIAIPVSSSDLQPTLTNFLQSYSGRPVLDKTGLTGLYDFRLRFVPDGISPGAAGLDVDAESFFTAVEGQLGLRLQTARGPAEVMVIDSIELPTAN